LSGDFFFDKKVGIVIDREGCCCSKGRLRER